MWLPTEPGLILSSASTPSRCRLRLRLFLLLSLRSLVFDTKNDKLNEAGAFNFSGNSVYRFFSRSGVPYKNESISYPSCSLWIAVMLSPQAYSIRSTPVYCPFDAGCSASSDALPVRPRGFSANSLGASAG